MKGLWQTLEHPQCDQRPDPHCAQVSFNPSRFRPTGADLLDPVPCDELMALWKRMHPIPDPVLWRSCLGRRIEDLLGPDMHGIMILGQPGNDLAQLVGGASA